MFKIGKKYKINTKSSFYTCEIIEENDIFVLFKDKYGSEIGVNKSDIIDFKEVNQ